MHLLVAVGMLVLLKPLIMPWVYMILLWLRLLYISIFFFFIGNVNFIK